MMNLIMEGRDVASLIYYTAIELESMRKATKTSDRIVDVPAQIRTGHLPNISLERRH
jgi:hypothetical protein